MKLNIKLLKKIYTAIKNDIKEHIDDWQKLLKKICHIVKERLDDDDVVEIILSSATQDSDRHHWPKTFQKIFKILAENLNRKDWIKLVKRITKILMKNLDRHDWNEITKFVFEKFGKIIKAKATFAFRNIGTILKTKINKKAISTMALVILNVCVLVADYYAFNSY